VPSNYQAITWVKSHVPFIRNLLQTGNFSCIRIDIYLIEHELAQVNCCQNASMQFDLANAETFPILIIYCEWIIYDYIKSLSHLPFIHFSQKCNWEFE